MTVAIDWHAKDCGNYSVVIFMRVTSSHLPFLIIVWGGNYFYSSSGICPQDYPTRHNEVKISKIYLSIKYVFMSHETILVAMHDELCLCKIPVYSKFMLMSICGISN
jgi:hypothetical protein